MRLTMKERRAVTQALVERYRKAGKKQKGRILDEFTALTSYHRCYAAHQLGRHGKQVRIGRVQLLAPLRVKPRRQRTRRYDAAVLEVLKPLWRIMDYPCGKRFSAMPLENEFKW